MCLLQLELIELFVVQLKRMSDEAENMMAYIEGRSERSTNNQPPCFTKQSLEELELGIRTLAENCKTVKVIIIML